MIDSREMVVEKNGNVRQAGANSWDQDVVKQFRESAESSLYAFSKGVLNKHWFSDDLHLWSCDWLQKTPPHRKLLMLPRTCCKTAIVSHALPIHIIIQPEEGNIYFPKLAGSECRILLAGEKETRSTDHLRVIETEFEGNTLLRALWPEVVWDNPRRESKKWNEKEMIVRRKVEYPDPTIRATGVGGAITGARPNVIIKDDLISIDAANSDVVMQTAIEWHIASRALLDRYDTKSDMQSLEFIIGTHWASWDLYTYIEENDPTVEVAKRSLYEIDERGDLKIIWPERYSWDQIDDLKKSFGARFWLMYMNQPLNSDLADFDMSMVRRFSLRDGLEVEFSSEQRDELIERRHAVGTDGVDPAEKAKEGYVKYGSDTHDRLFGGRSRFFNDKYLEKGSWMKDGDRYLRRH